MTRGIRIAVVSGLSAASLLAALLLVPRELPQSYHAFADTRAPLGIPNAYDVLSNGAFLLAGAAGLVSALGVTSRFRERWERLPWAVLFAGVALTAAGSAYYHLAPDDARLFWDRLPMAIVFGALLGILILERVSPRGGALLFAPIVLFSMLTVVVWRTAGDVRLYAFAQYFPVLALPLLLALFPPRYTGAGAYLGVLGCYAAAKLCEVLDRPIYDALGVLSGHTLKHLLAALGAAVLVVMLRRRAPVAGEAAPGRPRCAPSS